MNWAPGVQDQRGQLIMQGNEMSQRQGELMMQAAQYFQQRSDRKQDAIGQLSALGGTPSTGPGADAAVGYSPTDGGNDPGNEMGNPLDQAESAGKKADAIRGVINAYSPNPQSKTALKAMSLGQLEGMLKGYAVKSAMEEHAARIRDLQAQAEERLQRARSEQSIGEAQNFFFNAPPITSDSPMGDASEGGATVTRQPSLLERFQYATRKVPAAGKAGPRLIDELVKSYGAMMGVAGPNSKGPPQGIEINGHHIVWSPDTGRFEQLMDPPADKQPDPVAVAKLQADALRSHRKDHMDWATQYSNAVSQLGMFDRKSPDYKTAQDAVQALKSDEPKLETYLEPIKAIRRKGKGEADSPAASAPPASAADGRVVVKTKADFDKLPAGTRFVGPDGLSYRK